MNSSGYSFRKNIDAPRNGSDGHPQGPTKLQLVNANHSYTPRMVDVQDSDARFQAAKDDLARLAHQVGNTLSSTLKYSVGHAGW